MSDKEDYICWPGTEEWKRRDAEMKELGAARRKSELAEQEKIFNRPVPNAGMPCKAVDHKYSGTSRTANDEPTVVWAIPHGIVGDPRHYVMFVNDLLRWIDRSFFFHQDWRSSDIVDVPKEEFLAGARLVMDAYAKDIDGTPAGAVNARKVYAMDRTLGLLKEAEPGEAWVTIMDEPLELHSPGSGVYVMKSPSGDFDEFREPEYMWLNILDLEEQSRTIKVIRGAPVFATKYEPGKERELSRRVTKSTGIAYTAFEVPKEYANVYCRKPFIGCKQLRLEEPKVDFP